VLKQALKDERGKREAVERDLTEAKLKSEQLSRLL
jgi:hypothetical protein